MAVANYGCKESAGETAFSGGSQGKHCPTAGVSKRLWLLLSSSAALTTQVGLPLHARRVLPSQYAPPPQPVAPPPLRPCCRVAPPAAPTWMV